MLYPFFYLNQKLSDKYHYKGDYLYLFIFINNLTISLSSTVFSYLLVKSLNVLTNSKENIEHLFRIEEKKMRKDNNCHSQHSLVPLIIF